MIMMTIWVLLVCPALSANTWDNKLNMKGGVVVCGRKNGDITVHLCKGKDSRTFL